jgi:hypothetical protein
LDALRHGEPFLIAVLIQALNAPSRSSSGLVLPSLARPLVGGGQREIRDFQAIVVRDAQCVNVWRVPCRQQHPLIRHRLAETTKLEDAGAQLRQRE